MLKRKNGSGRCFHTVVPDPDQDGALAMSDRPAQLLPQSPDGAEDEPAYVARMLAEGHITEREAATATTITSGQVERLFPGWAIALEHSLGVWNATRRDGHSIRVIIARSPGELAVKLWAAERPAPAAGLADVPAVVPAPGIGPFGPGLSDCPACFGTGLVHAGKREPCQLCQPGQSC
jgi:hypothetical protein